MGLPLQLSSNASCRYVFSVCCPYLAVKVAFVTFNSWFQMIADAVPSGPSQRLTSAAFSLAVAEKVQSISSRKSGWVSQLVYWESFSLRPWEVCESDGCLRSLLIAPFRVLKLCSFAALSTTATRDFWKFSITSVFMLLKNSTPPTRFPLFSAVEVYSWSQTCFT